MNNKYVFKLSFIYYYHQNKNFIKKMENDNKKTLYKIIFDLFDEDEDGFIDVNNLGNIMKSLGNEYDLTTLEDMLNECDTNNDKLIDFNEFMISINKRIKETDPSEEYIEAFKIFDRDGSGKILIDELKEILLVLGENITQAEIEQFFMEANVKNNGYIEYVDFIRLLLSK